MIVLTNIVIGGIGNAALIVTGSSVVIIFLYRMFTRYKDTTKAIEDSAKINAVLTSLVNIEKLVKEQKEEIAFIKKEVQFNGGHSTKDVIVKTGKQLDRIEAEISFGKVAIRSVLNKQDNYWFSDDEGHTTEVGDKVLELLNKTEEELLGLGWTNYIHSDDIERVIKAFKESQELSKDFNEDYRVNIGKNNSRKYININAYARRIYSNKKFIGYYGIITKLD